MCAVSRVDQFLLMWDKKEKKLYLVPLGDMNRREFMTLLPLLVLMFVTGVYPTPTSFPPKEGKHSLQQKRQEGAKLILYQGL